MNRYSVDVEHKRKFFEEMKWAPFIVSRLFSAHSTFWMLGYDILSKEMDNILSFYVDRGCNCPMKVWFTRENKISRKSKEMLNRWFEITEFGNSKCPKTRTEETYNLIGNIEIEINFKIFINNLNATATFKLNNNERNIGIYVYENKIIFEKNDVNGDWSQSKIDILPNKNIMREGMTLNIKIKLFKFYCEFTIGNETKTFTNKFWYSKWWYGKKYLTFKNLEVFGDFIRVNAITETENEKIQHIPLPHSTRIFNNFMTNGSIATIRVQINKNAQNFQLLLLHDSPEFNLNIGATVLSIYVDYNNNIINSTSFSENNYHNNATIRGANIYSKGKPIQITIKMQNIIKKEENTEFYNIYINGKECHSYIGGFPFWSTNWIQVKGDAVLLEEPFITSPKLQLKETEKIYKYELDQLPFIGSTFCLEGTLPKSSDVEGIEKLVISLMHESNDESKSFGDTLLKMNFQFTAEHGESWLKITSKLYKGDKTNEKKYANPIGLSGVDLTVRINVEESYFKIYFNDGKTFIKYNYVAPPWMVNWIMVNFIGSTFCLEGTLPKSSDVEGIEKLVISLMHESNDESKSFGDTLLKMNFQFTAEHGESWLKITSKLYKGDKTNEKKYANPIGLSGVDLTVRINVEESYFKIYFNDGKTFIKYNYVAPPWMVNWIMVKGNINNVKFGNDAERCSKYISKPLPPHITKIKNLKEGKHISVKGKVTKLDENILINFYYGALGWDEKRGNVVLQAKITNQNITFCKKFKKNYICDSFVKNLTPKLEIGQIINMVFLATKTNFEIYYDDQEIYQFELPLWAIHYVEVTGPLTNIEGRNKIAEIRN
ncbi:unnamed protein product [Meloidogyne enterolobii]|uniref:Uncharacterized protein n=1 Tax=Meloidogyne enterolobii TaxID=390850 RepID=A0ACB1AXI3_MELEN